MQKSTSTTPQRVLFLDRDGTLIREPADFKIDSLEKLHLIPGVITALQKLRAAGYKLVMVSNQDQLDGPGFHRNDFELVHERLLEILAGEGVVFEAIYIDNHRPEDNHPMRKPNPGMVEDYCSKHTVDRPASFVIGDRRTDAMLADRTGCKSITIRDPQSADGDLEYCSDMEQPPTQRFTNWVDITAHLLAQ